MIWGGAVVIDHRNSLRFFDLRVSFEHLVVTRPPRRATKLHLQRLLLLQFRFRNASFEELGEFHIFTDDDIHRNYLFDVRDEKVYRLSHTAVCVYPWEALPYCHLEFAKNDAKHHSKTSASGKETKF